MIDMVFSELRRLSNSDRQLIAQNPKAKPKSRRLRRAEAKQASLEAKNLVIAANTNISTIDSSKKSI